MLKNMIIILLLMFYVMPIMAQENNMPITREERIYNDSEARYFKEWIRNYSHPIILRNECSMEDIILSKEYQYYKKAWFDKNNNITRWETLNEKGERQKDMGATEYQYDVKGRLTLVILLDGNNNIKHTIPWKRTFFEKMKDKLGS